MGRPIVLDLLTGELSYLGEVVKHNASLLARARAILRVNSLPAQRLPAQIRVLQQFFFLHLVALSALSVSLSKKNFHHHRAPRKRCR